MIVEQMLNNAPKPLLHIADVSGSALFQGDCLDIMPLIPDKSVQLILADLPYGTTACKWDSIIDLDLLWKQYKRIIKDNGVIALTATQPFASKLINNDLKMFKQELIWDKIMPVGHLIAGKRIMSVHENILLFWNKQPIFNRQFTERKPEDRRKNIIDNYNNLFTTSKTELVKNTPETRFAKGYDNTKVNPKSIISITKRMAHKDRTHPTQKPLELMKYLISTYSNENDMVLDNTMGSGTTCLAAKELNRKFIGIEKEPKYYEIACQRCGF